MDDLVFVIVSGVLGTVITVLSFWLVFYIARSKLKRAQVAEPKLIEKNGGVNIPLVAAFSGWKVMPWVSWLSSDISPILLLDTDNVTYRVVRKRSNPYHEIDYVDFRETFGTTNIILVFKGKLTTFVGNTANIRLAAKTLELFQQKGCRLSERALHALKQNTLANSL